VGVAHMSHERNTRSDKATLRLLRTGNLAAGLGRKLSPDVAHVDADFFEYVSPHETGLAAALEAVALGLAPTAGLETCRGLETFEACADAALQITEISRGGGGEVGGHR